MSSKKNISTVRQSRNRSMKKKVPEQSSTGVARMFRINEGVNTIYTRRIVHITDITANASGYIPSTTLASTNAVTTYGDFATIAATYSNYRVRAIKSTVHPYYPIPLSQATAVTVAALIFVVPFRSGLIPSTNQAMAESSEVRLCSGYRSYTFETSNQGYPDGKLWNPTNAVIAGADAFGLCLMGNSSLAATANAPTWKVVTEYLVEFELQG